MDRAAEQGNGASNKNAEEGFLWNVLISAAERKEQAGARVRIEQKGIFKMIEELIKFLRKQTYAFVENKSVDFIVLLAVIFSVVLVQIDRKEAPLFAHDTRMLIDYSLLGFFGVETGLKMFAYGVFSQSGASPKSLEFPKGKPAFISNTEEGGWNAIDMLVVTMMIVGSVGVDAGGWKCVRIVRVVRPLQKQNQDVKQLMAALMSSFTAIMHVINLLMLLIFIFGLMGVNLFRGRFHFCNDESVLEGYEKCTGTNFGGRPDIPCVIGPSMCEQGIGKFLGQEILVPRVWSVKRDNFDNLYAASLTLLRLSSQDNLRPIFHSVMDIPASFEYLCPGSNIDATNGCPDGGIPFFKARQPVINEKPENIVFPITYVFVANIFISQLVIGVLIDNIRRQTGTALYTEEQRVWNATKQTLERLSEKVQPPDLKGFQKILYEFLEGESYEIFITTIIILNTLWMATEHEPHVQLYLDIANVVGWFFITIYVTETFAKLYVFQPLSIVVKPEGDWIEEDRELKEKGGLFITQRLQWKNTSIRSPYFEDAWNSFDFVVVAFSVLDSIGVIDFAVLKLLRVLRVLRLVRRVKTLQMMLVTLIKAIPSILAALLFLGIFIFIWAAVGSDPSFFLNLKQGQIINSTWNFSSLMNAILLLFRTATGDGWFDLIYDASIMPPFCTHMVPAGATMADGHVLLEDQPGDCGLGGIGQVYFIIFYLLCNFIFLPLFVATLINYFFEAEVDSISLFNEEACSVYSEVWSDFGKGDSISISQLRPFIDRLGAVNHSCGFNTASDMNRFKGIWARVMSEPPRVPEAGIPVDAELQDDLHLSVITRDNIKKAYGEGPRAKAIREFLYKYWKESGVVGVRDHEVKFKYLAKVLCIFQEGICKPNTTSDLINLGTAKQMLVAMKFKGEIGGIDNVPGRDGAEQRRWSALSVHNRLQLQRPNLDEGGAEKQDNTPGPDQLPLILKAQGLMQLELRPPVLDPDEPPPKPSGEKMAEILGKTQQMQQSFDSIIDRLIDDILWGSDDGSGVDSVLELKLDSIIEQSVEDYAEKTVTQILARFVNKRVSKQTYFSQRAEQLWSNEQNTDVALVKSVPRGWLNAGRTLGVPRQLRGPGPRRARRIPEPDDAVDRTGATVETLRKFSALPRPPALPPAFPNLPSQTLVQGPGARLNTPGQSAVQQRVRQMRHNGTWQEMLSEWKALDWIPLQGASSARASSVAASEGSDSCAAVGISDNWKIQYSRRLDKKSQASVRFGEYVHAAAGGGHGGGGGEGGSGGGECGDDAGEHDDGAELDDRERAFESLAVFKSVWDKTLKDVKLLLP